ncbi:gp58-like family protein [Heyndrickxia sporothermodurans]|uniref:gp58-like family protein n=1 Tax=Heyndrickxia sporothermodurans TaxID=46224 RepID=UPI002E1A6011|nr:gp58-like family protein [Heyndrickxia sporothermodurans]MED3697366.1 gp58-like family protein [Heyndrickxia sporothermodurans]
MALMGSVDISFTKSTQIANEATKTANDASKTATDAKNTANNASKIAEEATQKAIEAIQSADGKNTNFYGSEEPTNPKIGDLWFKEVDGEYTQTFRYDGTQWVLIVDMDTSLIQKEAQKARDDAQSAVDRANKATQDAQDAIAKAQEGFDKAVNANDIALVAKQMSETASSVASDAYKQAGTAITNAQSALDSAEKSLSDISKLDQSVQTQISNINGQLSSKVSQSTFNVLQGTVNTHTTQIQQTLTDITSKADKTLVDTIKKTVDSHSTLISQNATDIKARATQSSVDTLTGRVTTAEANININAKAITQNMLDVTNNYATKSLVEQTAGSLTSTISKVQTNLDNLQIGGRNLLTYSDLTKQQKGVTFTVDGKSYNTYASGYAGYNAGIVNPTVNYHAYIDNDTFGFPVVVYNESNGSRNWKGSSKNVTSTVTEAGVYTVSFDVYATGEGTKLFGGFYYTKKGGTTQGFHAGQYTINIEKVNQWYRVSAIANLGEDVDFEKYVNFYFYGYGFGTNSILYVRKFKLEKGNKASDWSPAPEDMATVTQFSSLEQTLNGFTTRVGNAEGAISSLQQTANSLSSKVADAEKNISSLTQTAQGLQSAVNSKADSSVVTQLAGVVDTKVTSSQVNSLIATDKQIKDTRSANEKPSYYLSNYPRQTVREFKTLSVVGITTDGAYGILETIVPWSTSSGGQIKQTLYTDKATYERKGVNSNDSWTEWKKIADVDYVSTQITQTTNSITQTINNTKADLQSQISQLDKNINLRVQKGDVINQINISTEGILIDGKKVHITGQTSIDNAVIKDAMIDTINATKITTGTLDALKVSVKNLSATSITGGTLDALKVDVQNLSASKILTGELDASKVVVKNLSASSILSGTLDASKVNVANLNANNIKSGVLSSIEIRGVNITGSTLMSEVSSTNYTKIVGGYLESRGTYNRTWRGLTETQDVKIRIENGYLRTRNDSEDRSIYFSDFGVSTYADGNETTASGTLSFFNTDYSNSRGVSLQSGLGAVSLVSNQNRIVLDANTTVNIESETSSIYLRPFKMSRPGKNEFRFWIKDNTDASATDGVLTFGDSDVGQASGLRFQKSTNGTPVLWVTNGNGDIGTGHIRADRFIGDLATPASYAYVRSERLRVVQGSDNTNYSELQVKDILANSIRVNSGDLYLGCSGNEVRVTNNLLWNGGNTGYRPIRASAFNNGSSRKYKTNIELLENVALDIINDLQVVEYDLIDELTNGVHNNRQVGLISEDSPAVATVDGMAINMYKLSAYNTKAIQELDTKVTDITDDVEWLKIENQYLKQKIKSLEEKVV